MNASKGYPGGGGGESSNPIRTMAAPEYLQAVNTSAAPPGHRFRIYFKGWDEKWKPSKDKRDLVTAITDIPESVYKLLQAVRNRQSYAARKNSRVAREAFRTKAPFVTGTGIEHPLENGFAFLDPYGLPYFPGSSVKGVVRRAAEELALFDAGASGWTMDAVWWFFGFDANSGFLNPADRQSESNTQKASASPAPRPAAPWQKAYAEWARRADGESVKKLIGIALPPERREQWEKRPDQFLMALCRDRDLRNSVHLRGSLCFWDVFPDPPGQSKKNLRCDLMNPHYGHYYRERKTEPPGDWGNPSPIFFLSIPEATEFHFFVECQPLADMPGAYQERWRELVGKALDHAGEWLGFGAKTSQGYGRLTRLSEPAQESPQPGGEEIRQKTKEREQEARRELESLPSLERWIRELERAGEQRTHEIYRELAQLRGDEQRRLAEALKQAYERLGKWSGKQSDKQKEKIRQIRGVLGEPS